MNIVNKLKPFIDISYELYGENSYAVTYRMLLRPQRVYGAALYLNENDYLSLRNRYTDSCTTIGGIVARKGIEHFWSYPLSSFNEKYVKILAEELQKVFQLRC